MAKRDELSIKKVMVAMEEIRQGRMKPVKYSRGCIFAASLELVRTGAISVAQAERAQGKISEADVQSLRLDRCCGCGHQFESGMMPGSDDGEMRYRKCSVCDSDFAYLQSEGRLT